MKKRRKTGILLLCIILLSGLLTGARGDTNFSGMAGQIQVRLTFYQAEEGLESPTIDSTTFSVEMQEEGEWLKAVVNQNPEEYRYEEGDGFPKVYQDYASWMQTDITEECHYDSETGIMEIPQKYEGCNLTVKSVMPHTSPARNQLCRYPKRVGSERLERIRLAAEETPGVGYRENITGGQVFLMCDYDLGYGTGLTNRFDIFGMQQHRTGHTYGFCVTDLQTDGTIFHRNVGTFGLSRNSGYGDYLLHASDGNRKGYEAYDETDWGVVRCVWADCAEEVNNGSGESVLQGGYVEVRSINADGTLHCYFYISCAGPGGQNYQDVDGYVDVTPPYGSLQLTKKSAHPELSEENRCYSLEGAEYTLYDEQGAACGTITTDQKGRGSLEQIVPGTYTLRETRAAVGYAIDQQSYAVEVIAAQCSTLEVKENPVYARPELLLKKVDRELGEGIPQGNASLAGAEFQVQFYDCQMEENVMKEGEKPVRNWVFRTDDQGHLKLEESYLVSGDALYTDREGNPVLPLGTITMREIKAPLGYRLNEQIYIESIAAGEAGIEVVDTYQVCACPEQIKRGDLSFVKVAGTSMKRMAEIPFRVTSKTTGESHILVTDENGFASTSAAWTPHTQNTNEGKRKEDGIWFGGQEGIVDDTKGALPYDVYTIEELRCEQNKNYLLIPPFDIAITRDAHELELGTLTDEMPFICTTAWEKEQQVQQVHPGEKVQIVDTVQYTNLVPGEQYTFQGTLVEQGTGKPILADGEPVSARETVVPRTPNGSVQVEFALDTDAVTGDKVVVFEEVYQDGELLTAHEDLDNEDQTITILNREETGGEQEKPVEKVERTTPEHVRTKDVKTGDEDRILQWMYLLLLMLFIIALCLGRRWKRYDHLIKK